MLLHFTEVSMGGIMEVKSSEEFMQLSNEPAHLTACAEWVYI